MDPTHQILHAEHLQQWEELRPVLEVIVQVLYCFSSTLWEVLREVQAKGTSMVS